MRKVEYYRGLLLRGEKELPENRAKSCVINVRLDPETHALLKKLKGKIGVSIQQIMNDALDKFLLEIFKDCKE